MQFLWKYIDDISGKGIGTLEIMELFFYFALTLIPKAIPITILLSSVFVFGNMSEKFELTSMKSAGISFYRIMRVGIMIGVLTALLSVIASNLIVPKANEAFLSRFYGIKKAKPSMVIEKGIFNDDFTGYRIYVSDKDKNGQDITGVLIYDHTNVESKRINVITAKHGKMSVSDDGEHFVMTLYDGEQIRELKENLQHNSKDKSYPLTKANFKQWQKSFDMTEFQLKDDESAVQRRPYDLMNTPQLLYNIDSINAEIDVLNESNLYDFSDLVVIQKDKGNIDVRAAKSAVSKSDNKTPSMELQLENNTKDVKKENVISSQSKTSLQKKNTVQRKKTIQKKNRKVVAYESVQVEEELFKEADSFIETILPEEQKKILKSAATKARHLNNQILATKNKLSVASAKENLLHFKVNQQYSWALICLMFLFIGAPLGSIIRKGGYGFPLLVSILFFMLFIIMDIMGNRLMAGKVINPYLAAWLPNLVLFPFAILFTYKAVRDSRLSFSWLKNILSRFSFSNT
jgi:lipopolysaccharide export system permease protein